MVDTSIGAIVKTEGVSTSLQGIDVLEDLDLDLSEHSIFGFLGPNGTGKTTTIKLLLGLLRGQAQELNRS